MIVENITLQRKKGGPYFFHNLSFVAQKGKIHAVEGKNGVGKSVLFRLLEEQKVEEGIGEVVVSTQAICSMPQKFDESLVGPFSFLENLRCSRLGKYPKMGRKKKEPLLTREEETLLERFHIDQHLPVEKLSGGQRQILSLLLHVRKSCEVLLLDEPTAALDEENAEMVFEFLRLLPGQTILVICHDRELLARYVTGDFFVLQRNSDGVRTMGLSQKSV